MAIPYNSNYDETIPFSDTCIQLNLATGVDQTWTIPGTLTQQFQAIFAYPDNASVYVCKNGTAISPVSGTQTNTQYCEFKPDKRYVRGGDTLSLVCPDSSGVHMGISLRQLQG